MKRWSPFQNGEALNPHFEMGSPIMKWVLMSLPILVLKWGFLFQNRDAIIPLLKWGSPFQNGHRWKQQSPFQNRDPRFIMGKSESPFWNSNPHSEMGINTTSNPCFEMGIPISKWECVYPHFETGIPILKQGSTHQWSLFWNGDARFRIGVETIPVLKRVLPSH